MISSYYQLVATKNDQSVSLTFVEEAVAAQTRTELRRIGFDVELSCAYTVHHNAEEAVKVARIACSDF